MYADIKGRVHSILEQTDETDLVTRVFNFFLLVLIVINVLAVILDTVQSLMDQYSAVFWAIEVISVAIFSVEYMARLWVCNLDEQYRGPTGRIKYVLSPMAIIDLLAILPFYLPLAIPFDLRILRLLRLFRLFRLFKLARYNESLIMMKKVLADRKEDLGITIFVGIVVLILASSMMYYAEHDAQPDKFTNIPVSMYYGVITLATIGYGDIYPITLMGKFFSAIIAITGIGMFAMPAGIIGSGFVEELQKKRDSQKIICPHCGKDINEAPEQKKEVEEMYINRMVEYPYVKK